jgi:hypothetical protein
MPGAAPHSTTRVSAQPSPRSGPASTRWSSPKDSTNRYRRTRRSTGGRAWPVRGAGRHHRLGPALRHTARQFETTDLDPAGIEADTVMPQFRDDGDQPDALPAIRALTATLFAQLDEQAQQIASGRLADLDVPVTVPFGEGDDYVNPGGRAPPRPPSRQRALAAGSGGVALTSGGPARRCRPPPHRGAHHDLSRSRLRTSRSRSGNRTGGGVARADDWFQEVVTVCPRAHQDVVWVPSTGSALVLGFR